MSQPEAKKPWQNASGWTDDRTDLAKKLWKDGLSASQIAKKLGGVTRNAVIGKIARLGLTRSDQGRKAAQTLGHKRRAPRVTAPRKAPPKLAIAGNGAIFEKAPAVAPVTPTPTSASAWSPLPGAQPILIAELTSSTCRWPIDMPVGVEVHYCGRSAEGVYCATHTALSVPRTPGAKEHLDQKLGIALGHSRQVSRRAA